jgi:hypothetical protein
MKFNKDLPEEIQLTDDDMDVMLQFFHDVREILYFDQDTLRNTIIMDIQWFSNAFKNIITDKNHAQDDLDDYIIEWERLNETGELTGELLKAIWRMHGDAYLQYKEEIMLYMEKLGLLAAMKSDEEKWYIPSMNRAPFDRHCFSKFPSSSIMCFQFDVLPAGVFHRLVAALMQVPYDILTYDDKACIYKTAAIFTHDDHNVLIGMTKSTIQLQVFVVKGDVDPICCRHIGQKVEELLRSCSTTFQSNFQFSVGFKCKPTGFCDEDESLMISKEKFTKPSFQCPRCPVQRKHIIQAVNITRYWTKVTSTCGIFIYMVYSCMF